ncbi:hypothetical protein M1432_02570 [Patescibacteria group bacterium]|nr:hypothetical protein [Patescibacteria group bacterium]
MIIHLYGPDSYRRKMKLRELLADYFKKYPAADFLDVDFIEDQEAWEKARDFLSQPSMFTPSKVLVAREGTCSDKASKKSADGAEGEERDVKGAAAWRKQWAGVLKKYAEEPKIFVFLSDSGKPLKAFDFLLKKPVRSSTFDELAGEGLRRFVAAESEAHAISFSPEALRFFLGFLESAPDASWNAVNEIEKLSLMDLPQPIAAKSIEPVIEWSSKTAVFEGARAIMWARNRTDRMKLLEKLFLQKEAAAYVFNSLGFMARGGDAVRLADYDASVKSGGLDYEEALLDFVLR